jgi:hypothetical protein
MIALVESFFGKLACDVVHVFAVCTLDVYNWLRYMVERYGDMKIVNML